MNMKNVNSEQIPELTKDWIESALKSVKLSKFPSENSKIPEGGNLYFIT